MLLSFHSDYVEESEGIHFPLSLPRSPVENGFNNWLAAETGIVLLLKPRYRHELEYDVR
jgi:hypothetical protein